MHVQRMIAAQQLNHPTRTAAEIINMLLEHCNSDWEYADFEFGLAFGTCAKLVKISHVP